jgi:Fur family transcriptional regulator, ferric uptake regulator
MSDSLLNNAKSELARQGIRLTPQRKAIVETAFRSEEHFTAEDVLERAQLINSSVSRATVYRTLDLLISAKLLQKIELGRDFTYYDPNYQKRPGHHHLICLDCQRIVEFEDKILAQRENRVTKDLGFIPAAQHLRIDGHCQTLKTTGTCSYLKR